jgi:hypothetical protein
MYISKTGKKATTEGRRIPTMRNQRKVLRTQWVEHGDTFNRILDPSTEVKEAEGDDFWEQREEEDPRREGNTEDELRKLPKDWWIVECTILLLRLRHLNINGNRDAKLS